MKLPILSGVVLAIVGMTIASPLAEPAAEPVSAATENSPLLEKRVDCSLPNPAPGSGSIPCRAGANTGYDVVVYYHIGWVVDAYCKANGGAYQGYVYVVIPSYHCAV